MHTLYAVYGEQNLSFLREGYLLDGKTDIQQTW